MKNIIFLVILFLSVKLTAQTKDSSTKKEVYLEIRIELLGPFAKNSGYYFTAIMGGKYLKSDSLQRQFRTRPNRLVRK